MLLLVKLQSTIPKAMHDMHVVCRRQPVAIAHVRIQSHFICKAANML